MYFLNYKLHCKMYFLMIILSSLLITNFGMDTSVSNVLSCPNDQKCMFIDHCPSLMFLMSHNELPVHRFRQAICGYDDIRPKVCCDVNHSTIDTYTDSSLAWGSASNVQCGNSLIRSGVKTLGSYPFIARIGFINMLTGDIKYSCSGAILNEKTIITTATCALATSSRYKLYSVRVGEYDSSTNPDCNSLFCGHSIQEHNISYVVKHPNFHAESFTDNIALIRLKQPIQFTITAQPICLMPEDRYVPVGTNVVIVGWGKLSNQPVKSTVQESIEMNILPRQDCFMYTRQGLIVELCAIGEQEPCSGYSGSPLLLRYGNTYYLTGLLSYGSECQRGSNLPSVFVDVQNHRRWIQENC